jgi:hypothetical protein
MHRTVIPCKVRRLAMPHIVEREARKVLCLVRSQRQAYVASALSIEMVRIEPVGCETAVVSAALLVFVWRVYRRRCRGIERRPGLEQ